MFIIPPTLKLGCSSIKFLIAWDGDFKPKTDFPDSSHSYLNKSNAQNMKRSFLKVYQSELKRLKSSLPKGMLPLTPLPYWSSTCLGDIPWFQHFVWVGQLGDADCVISIESLHDGNISMLDFWLKSVYFRRARTSHFLTRDIVTLNNKLSRSHSPRPLAAGSIRNTENMESLLAKAEISSQIYQWVTQ